MAITTAAGGPSQAQMPFVEQAPPARADAWQLAAGARNTWIGGAGFDPFSDDDHMAQFSMTASRAFGDAGGPSTPGLRFAVGVGYDAGSASALARGARAELMLYRVLAYAEGRYHVGPRFYAFGRLAPGFAYGTARLNEPSAPAAAPLVDDLRMFSLDASAGAAFCVNGVYRKVGVWLLADAGYGWAPDHRLTLTADLPARDRDKVAPLDLGTVAIRGPLLRFALALSY